MVAKTLPRPGLALLSIALVVWLSFAATAHQSDHDVGHHSDHHCQLFAGAAHGIQAHQVYPAPPIALFFGYQDFDLIIRERPQPVERARSPPSVKKILSFLRARPNSTVV